MKDKTDAGIHLGWRKRLYQGACLKIAIMLERGISSAVKIMVKLLDEADIANEEQWDAVKRPQVQPSRQVMPVSKPVAVSVSLKAKNVHDMKQSLCALAESLDGLRTQDGCREEELPVFFVGDPSVLH